jgi:hypothetical protein
MTCYGVLQIGLYLNHTIRRYGLGRSRQKLLVVFEVNRVLKEVQTEVHLNKSAEYIVKGVQRAVFSNILKYGLELALQTEQAGSFWKIL